MCAKLSRKKSGKPIRKKAEDNPFETLVLKNKHNVLNRGVQSKRPGKLQRISYEKRVNTLGKEFAQLHKTNQFLDARLNSKYARPQSKTAQAKEMLNLNLTHAGRTINEIENFDDVPDGADDDDEDGVLQDTFTRATHFGGGSDDEDNKPNSRMTVIENMIAESKRLKMQRQQENDEIYEMRQKLDSDLKSMMSQVKEHIRRDEDRPKPDDYDRAMREMIFEPRGVPSEKLKSIDLAATEQKRREALEREKQERMKSDFGAQQAAKANRPISADALSDGYLLTEVHSEPEEDGEEDPYDEDESGESSPDGEDEGSTEDESDVDSLSDLKNAHEESDDDEDEEEPEPEPEPVVKPKTKATVVEPKTKPAPAAKQETKASVTDSKTKPEPVRQATYTPRIVDVPQDYEQFAALLDEQTDVHERITVVFSMMHTLKVKSFLNKSRWSVLYAYALNYIGDRFAHATEATIEAEFHTLDLLTPLIHDMAQTDPSATGKVFLDVVEQKYGEFKAHPKRYPPLSALVLLKLVPVLFSASDRKHSIVTPALVFIGEILTRCQVRNRRDLARGLFMVTTVLECVEQSKRFLPAVISFLTGALQQACARDATSPVGIVPSPFKVASSLLVTEADDVKEKGDVLRMTAQDLLVVGNAPACRVRMISCTVSLLAALCMQLDQCVAISTIAKHLLRPLDALDQSPFPATLRDAIERTKATLLQLSKRPLAYLVQAEQKPKPLRLYEPKINPVYEDIRRRPKEAVPLREQRRKLQQKVRKMTRGAARELRLDNEFLAKLQHKRRMEGDRERQEKVRKIFSYASSQQGELKSLDRRAKYRK